MKVLPCCCADLFALMASGVVRAGAVLLGLGAAVADSYAVAEMRAATGWNGAVSGSVKFRQPSDGLADVTVEIDIEGLSPGQHGFHVHQYGDVRATGDLSTIGAHFTPYCIPPEIIDEDGDGLDPDEPGNAPGRYNCKNDQIHGWPPSIQRQSGDMGNITVDNDGAVRTTLTIGQGKMSLKDDLRSILGRTIVVHTAPDDGSQPYGNAGPPMAYGVIGIGAMEGNEAMAPNKPYVDKIICTYEEAAPGEDRGVEGSVLLTHLEPYHADTVLMQAVLSNFPDIDADHSFHFHKYGDMLVDYDELGPIYVSEDIDPSDIRVNSGGRATLEDEFKSNNLLQHVGRSITIHEGPTEASPTIAAAVCGLAHPSATLVTSTGEPFGQDSGNSGLSGWQIAIMTITIIVVTTVVVIALLFWLRMPIPFLGKFFYPRGRHNALMKTVDPPPPPRFDEAAASATQMTESSTTRV